MIACTPGFVLLAVAPGGGGSAGAAQELAGLVAAAGFVEAGVGGDGATHLRQNLIILTILPPPPSHLIAATVQGLAALLGFAVRVEYDLVAEVLGGVLRISPVNNLIVLLLLSVDVGVGASIELVVAVEVGADLLVLEREGGVVLFEGEVLEGSVIVFMIIDGIVHDV